MIRFNLDGLSVQFSVVEEAIRDCCVGGFRHLDEAESTAPAGQLVGYRERAHSAASARKMGQKVTACYRSCQITNVNFGH